MPKKTKIQRRQYSPRKMRQALAAIENGMAVRKASTQYLIPRSTLQTKISGKSPRETSGHGGFHSALGKETEEEIVKWILQASSNGFPISRDGLLTTVEKMILDGSVLKPGSFKSARPSKKWYYAFLKRHPGVRPRTAEYLNRARGSVTEEALRKWYRNVTDQLGDNFEVLRYPERIFNMDESAFCLAPTGEVVLGPANHHVYIESSKSDKENITTLFTVSATGVFAPPLTIYKYDRMPAAAVTSAPGHWSIGKSESGWMQSSTFYEYIGNAFLPFLDKENIEKPVIVFLDGHSSHLTLHLSKLCRERGIILIALFPNATHILQPLDVAVFKPMKSRWRNLKRQWRIDHNGREVSKFDVPVLLNTVISDEQMASNVRSGFRATGLYPFDDSAVDYSKIIERKKLLDDTTATSENDLDGEEIKRFKKYLESKIGPSLLISFEATRESGQEWSGDIESKDLFKVWSECESDFEKASAAALPAPAAPAAPPAVRKALEDNLAAVIHWPEATKKLKKDEDVPTVLTTDRWVDHYQKKEDDKKKEEQLKIERKQNRLAEKVRKEEEKIQKKEEKVKKQDELKRVKQENIERKRKKMDENVEGELNKETVMKRKNTVKKKVKI